MTASSGRPGLTHTIKELRWCWGESYDINWDWQSKVYRACRRDGGSALEHADPEELWQLIRRDYAANPVPPPGVEGFPVRGRPVHVDVNPGPVQRRVAQRDGPAGG